MVGGTWVLVPFLNVMVSKTLRALTQKSWWGEFDLTAHLKYLPSEGLILVPLTESNNLSKKSKKSAVPTAFCDNVPRPKTNFKKE